MLASVLSSQRNKIGNKLEIRYLFLLSNIRRYVLVVHSNRKVLVIIEYIYCSMDRDNRKIFIKVVELYLIY